MIRQDEDVTARLLPYWGLTYYQDTGTTEPGLRGMDASVIGLARSDFAELKRLLRHTGLNLSETEHAGVACFFIKVSNQATAPVTVRDQDMTYHLKPLQTQNENVQTWVHKHLWLAGTSQPFTLLISPAEQIHISEWLCYLLIQYFMQPYFTSLSGLSFEVYKQAVTTTLEPLNPALAARQLTLGRGSQEDWPKPPPQRETGKTFDPFHQNRDPSKAEPINPFRKQGKNTDASTIRPFRKKT